MSRLWDGVVCHRWEHARNSATGIPGAKRNGVAAVSLPTTSIADRRTFTDRHYRCATDGTSGACHTNSDDATNPDGATNPDSATYHASYADQYATANPRTAHHAATRAGCRNDASDPDGAGRPGMRIRSVGRCQWHSTTARAAIDLFWNPDRWRRQRACIRRLCVAIDPRHGASWNV